MLNMLFVVGLGNPGKKFEKTRHNIGFIIVEGLKLKVESFSDWKYEKKILAEISRGEINNQKAILAKPQTFMNNSGKSIKKLVSSSKFQVPSLFVVHDDIDLPFGEIRIVKNRGAAGHKGVESIVRELKTKNFVRFRIGIKPATGSKQQTTGAEKFVLQKFNKDEEKVLKEVIKKTVEAIEAAIKEGLEKAQSKYNMRTE